MKAFKRLMFVPEKIQVEIDYALEQIRKFNKPFCVDKTDVQLIQAMKESPVATNLSSYWIEE